MTAEAARQSSVTYSPEYQLLTVMVEGVVPLDDLVGEIAREIDAQLITPTGIRERSGRSPSTASLCRMPFASSLAGIHGRSSIALAALSASYWLPRATDRPQHANHRLPGRRGRPR